MQTLLAIAVLVFLAATASGADDFPTPYDSEPPDSGKPMSAREAADGFRLPPGFQVQVFAAEPEVRNPIGMAWDGRGRLWIAENYTYAERALKFDLSLRDQVLIFEDRDGDGQADSRKVFTDDIQRLTSVLIGRGGVWMMCPPQLLFVPDMNQDDAPDGPAQVQLDGFDVPEDNYHTIANGLSWGPDGWLYGRCGASSAGRIGTPGTPPDQRIPINGGLWRYHPEGKTFEVLAHGTTNPWGHDWNEYGDPFFINTVNGHLWHAFPGAHFRRPHTQDPNPRAYQVIGTHADHWHWDTGQSWMDSRGGKGVHNQLGGGHAHSGGMIYLADHLPTDYRGRLFTLNLHGRRINVERLERSGSGYVGRHEPDIFRAADTWFRGIEVGYGPDGGVFVLDWSDTGECHEHNGVHRLSGRIYKITFGKPAHPHTGDLSAFSSQQLVDLHRHANEWYVRQARRILVDRAVSKQDLSAVHVDLRQAYEAEEKVVQKLRYLWTLYATGGTDPSFLASQLEHPSEYVRAWAVRLLSDHWPLDTIMSTRPKWAQAPLNRSVLDRLVRQAAAEDSALVRLALTSTLQRLPVELRVDLAQPLCQRSEDANDHNLPSMLWFGLIPVAETHPASLIELAATAAAPSIRQSIARRLAEEIERSPQHMDGLVQRAARGGPEFQRDLVLGLSQGLAGWRKAPQPAGWQHLAATLGPSASQDLQNKIRELSVLFGDGHALDEVRQIALDEELDLTVRRSALETLIDAQPEDLREICQSLLRVRFLNTVAVRGLARFDDPKIGSELAKNYRRFHHSEREAVIETLVSRPSFAKSLLAAMATEKIPRAALSAFQARQIRSFGDPELTHQLGQAWGEIRESSADKQRAIAALKRKLTAPTMAAADRQNGRVVYRTVCSNCHRMYGRGGSVGPDLTGSGRHNLDYLLDNLLDPSAVVSADYRMSVLELNDGRVLNGIVMGRTDKTLTLHTAKEQLTVPLSEVEAIHPSKLSVMPDGLLQTLTDAQVRDLIAYLKHPTQVPLPPEFAGDQ